MNFTIIGAGAWGTAMAVHLEQKRHTVTLVPRRVEHALELSSARENKDYLPDVPLPQSLQIGWELKPALMEAEVVLLACPSHALREACEKIKAVKLSAWNIRYLVVLSKGLEKATFKRPSEVLQEVLPEFTPAVLSGPSFAAEVARECPTAVTLATPGDDDSARQLQEALSDEALRVYRSTDIAGVEMGGCLKNIYAIAAGICAGLELGHNALAALLTRALAEMVRLSTALGAQPETLYGLGGFGDLVATSFGDLSRNRTFGKKLAKGGRASDLLRDRKTVVEGYYAAEVFYQLVQQKGLEAPILSAVYAVLYEDKPPAQALKDLMTRDLKRE